MLLQLSALPIPSSIKNKIILRKQLQPNYKQLSQQIPIKIKVIIIINRTFRSDRYSRI